MSELRFVLAIFFLLSAAVCVLTSVSGFKRSGSRDCSNDYFKYRAARDQGWFFAIVSWLLTLAAIITWTVAHA